MPGSPLVERDDDGAAHPFRRHDEVDRAAELVGDEVADEARAVAGLRRRGRDRRAAGLAPCDRSVAPSGGSHCTDTRPLGLDSAPYFAALVTSSWSTIATAWVAAAVSITSGTADRRVRVGRVGRELVADELGEAGAVSSGSG